MKIAVLSSHTPSLFWFRMDMMKEFIRHGHTVVAISPGPESKWKNMFLEHGIEFEPLFVERNGINPLNDVRTFKELKQIIKKISPDKIFSYQAKTVVYGSLAAKANGISEVYPLIAGLGSIFRGEGLKNKILKTIMITEYRLACNFSKKVFFQNNDDKNKFLEHNLIKNSRAVIINGSGVSLDKFKPEPLPDKPAFLLIARIIKDKGIVEYLEACRRIKDEYPDVRCLLVGPLDTNPSALNMDDLNPYIDDGIIEYFGEQRDVRPFLKQCSTYVLPSYHEGTPKTVLEAMATGRSIITTDAPGCRETVQEGYNGYLIPPKDVDSLVMRMRYVIENPKISDQMAQNSLLLAREKYDVKMINKAIMLTMGLI